MNNLFKALGFDNEDYNKMSKEQLVPIATNLKNQNQELKNNLKNIIDECSLLKNSIINNSNDNNTQFGKMFIDLKNSLLTYENGKNINNNSIEFKKYLYKNNLFYGGIEEDNINLLKEIKVKQDDEWKNNKDSLLFKQKLLERNYKELFRNLLLSKEFNNILDKTSNENSNQKKNNFINNNKIENITLNDIITNNNNFNDNNNINDNINNNNQNIINNETNEIKGFPTQNKQNEKISPKKKESDFVTKMKQTLPKKQKKLDENLLNNLLSDEDEEISFSNLNKKQHKKGWDEDEE